MGRTESEADEAVRRQELVIRPEADADITEAYEWYEDQVAGLGLEFLEAVDACLRIVRRHPRMYQVVHKSVRRAPLLRFPYGLLYVVENDKIAVVACFHARRDPSHWQSRM